MDRRSFGAVLIGGATAAMIRARDLQAKADGHLVLSDFTTGDRDVSALGTRWRGFSDRVMGGRSTGQTAFDEIEGRPCLRLTGRVNTQGGGFIQMALPLAERRRAFDASAFAGFEMDVFGNGESYNAHLRTTDVRWYSQSYQASFDAPPRWTTIRLPWSAFKPHEIRAPLDTENLVQLGLLGWMRDFEADLAISRLALYSGSMA